MPDHVLPSVSVVIVTYNSRRYIQTCLDALADSSLRPIETIVVDNASEDLTPDLVKLRYPRVTLVRNDHNVGFAAGTNIGIRRSSGRYVLLLNPDAVVSRGCLRALVEHMEREDDIGLAGPRLLNDDRSLQYSIGRFPTPANQVGRLLLLNRLFPRSAALRELDFRDDEYERTHDVEWLFGAVLMAKREAFEPVGILDEAYFLFSEEQDWCWRMRQAGWRVSYLASAEAVHLGRGGVGNPDIFVLLLDSRDTFIRKHHGRGAAAAARALVTVGLAIRYVISMLTDRQDEADGAPRRSKAYASGLRWAVLDRRTP